MPKIKDKELLAIQKLLMDRSDIRLALNRHIASLNLQSQINRGVMTEAQAFLKFELEIKRFSTRMRNEIHKKLEKRPPLDQTDLSIPLNMQLALNNPNSYASQLMNDTAAVVIAICNEETIANEQVAIIENEKNDPTNIHSSPTLTPQHTHHNKEALLVESVLAVAAGGEVLKETAEKYLDRELKTHFKKEAAGTLKEAVAKLEEHISPFHIKLKPEPPKD